MIDKAPEAFRTISEVSDDLDLPQHVLRFWETKFAMIKPLKRGGGRRYYRPEDVDLLRGIRHLLYAQGFTIKGVQKILREQGVRYVATCWREDAPPVVARADIRPGALAGSGSKPDSSAGPPVAQLKALLKELRAAHNLVNGLRRGK